MKKYYRKYPEDILKQLMQEEMDIFVRFDSICKRNNIKYFATGGTLLGAIRHKGFIPWDDDIDIGMLRSEYDKFINLPSSEYEGFGLYAPEVNPGGFYSFVTKLYDTNSKYDTLIVNAGSGHSIGIHIELFPFDNVNIEKLKIQNRKVKFIKDMYTTVCCDKVTVFDRGIVGIVKRIVKYIIKMCAKLCGMTYAKLAKKYLDCIISDVETDYAYAFSDVGHLVKKAWIEETVRVPFENIEIEIPKYYQGVLEGLYGKEYMKLPPVEKRWNQAPARIVFKNGRTFIDETSVFE